jgi:hypothetical protein
MNAFVVTQWHASQTPDKEGNFVHIAGRKAGLVDYLLTLLKLNSRVLLKVSDSGLIFAESSLFGERNVNTPLSKVTTTIYGWKRPFWEAVFVGYFGGGFLGGIILVLAMVLTKKVGSQGIAFVIGAGAAVLITIACGAIYYRLNRVLTLGIVTESGETYWLRLKRSLIENIKLDQPLAEAASKVIDALVLARCAGTQTAGAGTTSAAPQVRPAAPVAAPVSPAGSSAPVAPPPAHPVNPPSGPASPPSGRSPAPTASSEPRATCIYCATRVSFPPAGAGMEVPCPTCGKPLLLVAS